MRRLIILICLFIFVTTLPTKNEREDTKDPEVIEDVAHPKVEVSVAKTKDGHPTIVVDITKRTVTDDNKKDELEVGESREIPEDKAEDKKGAPRSTIHIHTPNPPNINVIPQKYQINNMQATPYGSKPGYGSQGNYQAQTQNNKHKKEKEEKPYNQVNVYVYFPNDMLGMGESSMTVNSYSADGSSSSYSNLKKQHVQPVEPCPIGYARIKGVCLEVDQRRKKKL